MSAHRARIAQGIVCAALSIFLCAHAGAQTGAYPVKPLRFVVPYTPGGGTDLMARALAQRMTESMGQPVIVENRAGAGGNLGMEFVARSAPDGYTIALALTAQYVVNPALYPKLPYDPVKDYAPIMLVARNPYVLVVHPTVPAKSLRELIALAKQRTGQLTFSSSGNGSGAHLSGEMLKTMARVNMLHIPYKGAGALLPDLIAGQVHLSFVTWSSVGQHVKSGRLRALGVTTVKRSPALPELPAIAETLPGYDLPVWYGVVAPAGTSRDIIGRLNTEILRVLAIPDFRQRIEVDAVEPIGSTPEQLGDYIKTELVKWAKIVRDSGAKVD
jgi:tripartite-type tricarboxylate transporter receptor subunit TctC